MPNLEHEKKGQFKLDVRRMEVKVRLNLKPPYLHITRLERDGVRESCRRCHL